jgi:hypothetical protein
MTDGQRQAAAWLQVEGFTVTDTPGGFIAVHGFARMWVHATERKTVAGRSDDYGATTDEVRKIAGLETVRELLNGLKAKPATMEPWQARAVLKAAMLAPEPVTGG